MATVRRLNVGRYPPAVIVRPETTLLDMMLRMNEHGIRHAVVTDEEDKLKGIASGRHLMDLLGGGDRYKIAEQTYGGNLYEALSGETVSSIMRVLPWFTLDDTLCDIVAVMMERDIGAMPILDKDERVAGIVSEKHLMSLFVASGIHAKVREIMSRPLITLLPQATILEGQKTMVEKDIRRLVLKGSSGFRGALTLKDMVEFYSRDEVLDRLREGRAEEVHETPLQSLSPHPVICVDGEDGLEKALRTMRKNDVGYLIVCDREGIVTERDFLLKLPKLPGVEVYADCIEQDFIAAGRVHF